LQTRLDFGELFPDRAGDRIAGDEFAGFLLDLGFEKARGVSEQEVSHGLLFHLAKEVGIGGEPAG
jgi:hypothetical protein